jgi:site-specific DNA-methyltransferase (adenine-specific)
MKFNIVLGNPPYNNDIYLEFVKFGNKLSTNSSLWITPAKWQAKGGKENESFRNEIYPYISKLTYYMDCGDVFDIRINGGVAYYIVTKEKHNQIQINNKCNRVKQFNSDNYESQPLNTEICFLGNNKLYNICNKVGCFNKEFKHIILGANPIEQNYNVFASAINADAGGKTSFHTFSNDGKISMLAPFIISQSTFVRSNDTKCFFTSTNENESKSFISWINTKFVRFMVLMRYCTYHNNNDESWRFVPDPGAFDHIFTDEELYKKYELTQNEIDIIESVIKERNKQEETNVN